MNPFDLRGPEFLIFYLALGVATLIVVGLRRRANEAGGSAHAMIDDYLTIAYLRGGRNEALRVATLNLINRGLLEVSDDDRVRTRDAKAISTVSRRLERRILETFRDAGSASAIFSDAALSVAATVECEPSLVRLGLLPDAARSTTRLRLCAYAVIVLAAVATTKIVVAFARGRGNIQFLVMKAFLLVCIPIRRCARGSVRRHPPRRASRGSHRMKRSKSLFSTRSGCSSWRRAWPASAATRIAGASPGGSARVHCD